MKNQRANSQPCLKWTNIFYLNFLTLLLKLNLFFSLFKFKSRRQGKVQRPRYKATYKCWVSGCAHMYST